jgi:hypothetical protein
LNFLSPTMQSFISPMEINVLSDCRIYHFVLNAGQGFRVQRNVWRFSTLPDHSKRTTIKIDVSKNKSETYGKKEKAKERE